MISSKTRAVFASRTQDINESKNKCVAEIAVEVLSKEWPLPLKALQRKIKREFGREVSFQATHKALKKLVKQGILVKKSRYYQINIKWLDQLIEFGRQTKQAYEFKEKTGYCLTGECPLLSSNNRTFY